MDTLLQPLLIFGLLCPTLALLTGALSLYSQWRQKKHSSPIFIPFLGPLFLTSWVVLAHRPLWLLPIFWTADIGTLAFLAAGPQLIAEWWRVSRFTRIRTFPGSQDIQSAMLTLYSTGHYLLKKSCNRPPGQFGIVALGEHGTFTRRANQYELNSDDGVHRIFWKADDGTYHVEEDRLENSELQSHSLNGWLFESM